MYIETIEKIPWICILAKMFLTCVIILQLKYYNHKRTSFCRYLRICLIWILNDFNSLTWPLANSLLLLPSHWKEVYDPSYIQQIPVILSGYERKCRTVVQWPQLTNPKQAFVVGKYFAITLRRPLVSWGVVSKGLDHPLRIGLLWRIIL